MKEFLAGVMVAALIASAVAARGPLRRVPTAATLVPIKDGAAKAEVMSNVDTGEVLVQTYGDDLKPSIDSRSQTGSSYLFPRLVARSNYSRIGIARVRFNEAGDPVGVERLGSRWSLKLITNYGPMAAAARIRASRSSSRCSGM